jgi:hypothetical protein
VESVKRPPRSRAGRVCLRLPLPQGFLYVLDHQGNALEGWPIQMGEIQGQAVVGDLNGDGQLEIVAADTRGNVAAFDWRGKEVWERRLKSLIAQVRARAFACGAHGFPALQSDAVLAGGTGGHCGVGRPEGWRGARCHTCHY